MHDSDKLVWFAPNLNHYRVKIFNKLARRNLSLIAFSGCTDTNFGHKNNL